MANNVLQGLIRGAAGTATDYMKREEEELRQKTLLDYQFKKQMETLEWQNQRNRENFEFELGANTKKQMDLYDYQSKVDLEKQKKIIGMEYGYQKKVADYKYKQDRNMEYIKHDNTLDRIEFEHKLGSEQMSQVSIEKIPKGVFDTLIRQGNPESLAKMFPYAFAGETQEEKIADAARFQNEAKQSDVFVMKALEANPELVLANPERFGLSPEQAQEYAVIYSQNPNRLKTIAETKKQEIINNQLKTQLAAELKFMQQRGALTDAQTTAIYAKLGPEIDRINAQAKQAYATAAKTGDDMEKFWATQKTRLLAAGLSALKEITIDETIRKELSTFVDNAIKGMKKEYNFSYPEINAPKGESQGQLVPENAPQQQAAPKTRIRLPEEVFTKTDNDPIRNETYLNTVNYVLGGVAQHFNLDLTTQEGAMKGFAVIQKWINGDLASSPIRVPGLGGKMIPMSYDKYINEWFKKAGIKPGKAAENLKRYFTQTYLVK